MRRLQIAAAALIAALALAGVVYAAGASAPPAPAPTADVIAGLGLAPVAITTAETAACECPTSAEAPRAIVLRQVLANQADLKAQYDALIEELRASGDLTEAGAQKLQEAFAKMNAAPAPLALTMPAQPALAPEALMELEGQLGPLAGPGAEGLKLFKWKGKGEGPKAFAFRHGELDEELSGKVEAEIAEALKAAGVANGAAALELEQIAGLEALGGLEGIKGLDALKDTEALKLLQESQGALALSLSSDELARLEAELSKLVEETLPQLEDRLAKLEAELAQERAVEPKDR